MATTKTAGTTGTKTRKKAATGKATTAKSTEAGKAGDTPTDGSVNDGNVTRATILNPVAKRDAKATRETTTTRTVPAERERGEVIEMTVLHVNIVRDPMVKIPAEIFEHELPILEALNGEDNVEVVSEETVEVENFDVVDEYDRLMRKYRKLEQSNFAEVLGRSPRKLAKQLGMEYDDATTRRTRRSQALIKDGGRSTLASAPTRAKKGARSKR